MGSTFLITYTNAIKLIIHFKLFYLSPNATLSATASIANSLASSPSCTKPYYPMLLLQCSRSYLLLFPDYKGSRKSLLLNQDHISALLLCSVCLIKLLFRLVHLFLILKYLFRLLGASFFHCFHRLI